MSSPWAVRRAVRFGGLIAGSVLVVTAAVAVVPGAASGATNTAVPCSGPGGGSDGLIAAINSANSGGGGTITLAQGCTYSLTASNNGTNGSPMSGASGENGLPVITSQIQIVGSGTTIAANNTTFRILMVAGGGNLTLQGLTLTGGNSPFGGAIANLESTVTLDNTVVTGNTAAMGGGGIASGVLNPTHTGPLGSLTLNSSQVNGNKVTGGGPMMAGGGGGILNHKGTLTLNGSQVNGNNSGGGGGGIASGAEGDVNGSRLTLNNSEVDNNVSTGGPMAGAGGIANGGVATITGSQIDGNRAPGASGGGILNHGAMTIESSQVDSNSVPVDSNGNPGFGGGIANFNDSPAAGAPNSGTMTIDRTVIQGNSALLGSAIIEEGFNASTGPSLPGGPLTIEASHIAGNTSFVGGAVAINVGSGVSITTTGFGLDPTTGCSGRSGNDAWLCAVYLNALGRPLDPAGAAHFEGLLAHGVSRPQVADDIYTSDEYWKGVVGFFYQDLLGRDVDPAGRAVWVGQLDRGVNIVTVVSEIAGSQEFYKHAGSTSGGFVSALYTDLLGRDAGSSESSFWTSKLASGSSRTAVALGILSSTEYVDSALQSSYLGLLDRAASASELSMWASQLSNGVHFEAIEAQVAGSNEFYAKNH